MVDPTDCTKFDRSDYELQEYLLFCICVAGKTASIIAEKVDNFLYRARKHNLTPFEYLTRIAGPVTDSIMRDRLSRVARRFKLGQWKTRLPDAFLYLVKTPIDLRTCTVEELEAIPGVGPKTARYFLLHSRSGVRVAALDTHVLTWLRNQGYKAPRQSPTGKTYARLEKAFIEEAVKRELSLPEMDLSIWNEMSVRSGDSKKNRKEVSIKIKSGGTHEPGRRTRGTGRRILCSQ